MSPQVWAIIPAFARPALLSRLLASLQDQGPALARVLVVNNSGTPEITHAARAAAGVLPVTVLMPRYNLGTAGGIGTGLQALMQDTTATHGWILDDDAAATPGALAALLEAIQSAHADAAAPLLIDASGTIRWFPGPLPEPAWSCLKRPNLTPADFVATCGAAPRRWNWAIWASLLVSRRAVEQVGFPRMDLWSQFTDFEYTLRLTETMNGVLAPYAVCRHEPPPSEREELSRKVYWALQNACYVTLRLRHGRRAMRHLPGLFHRYLRHHRWRGRAWVEALAALVRGGMLGLRPCDSEFRELFAQAETAFPAWSRGLRQPR